MDIIDKLSEIFKEFPGIGERQAKRFVYFLMSKNGEYPENLSALIKELKKDTVQCSEYFILGGLVPIVEKNTSSRVRINELIKKIKNEKNLKEIILAFSLNPQGNHTDFYVRNQLKSTIEPLSIKISSLGKGLSTGTELEYSDNDTLKNALKNRQ